MEPKRTTKTDLESKRIVYFQIGLIMALSLSLLAFEWKQYERADIILVDRYGTEIFEDVIIPTKQQIEPPAPKPFPQISILQIVDNNFDVGEDPVINVEIDPASPVPEYLPPEIVLPKEELLPNDFIFKGSEIQPSFPGGETARIMYLLDNLKYPDIARNSGINGPVYLTFVVEPDGSISNIEILRGIGGGCDEEAIRVVQNMPNWIPGKQNGRPVRVQLSMCIKFSLK
jgi:protein TonB